MSEVRGETVAKNVRNIMAQTIGYEVAQAYTWTGQKKKIVIEEIVEIVQRNNWYLYHSKFFLFFFLFFVADRLYVFG